MQWHDNKTYEAYYRGKAPARKYSVKLQKNFFNCESTSFEFNKDVESEVVEVDQNEIFSINEPLPEEIRMALMKHKSESL